MSLPAGEHEARIRAAAVARLRKWWPSARICHEVNVELGSTRVDLLAVTSDTLVAVELKSAADKLDRLAVQMRNFDSIAHHAIVCFDEKWTESDISEELGWSIYGEQMWRFVSGEIETMFSSRPRQRSSPWMARMLNLLWRDELAAVCAGLNVSVGKREPRQPMIDELIRLCRAPELEQAVCRELRRRKFAHVDEPAEAAA